MTAEEAALSVPCAMPTNPPDEPAHQLSFCSDRVDDAAGGKGADGARTADFPRAPIHPNLDKFCAKGELDAILELGAAGPDGASSILPWAPHATDKKVQGVKPSWRLGGGRRTVSAMRDDDWAVGWGCAATMYPTQLSPATARVTVTPQGTVKVQTAAHASAPAPIKWSRWLRLWSNSDSDLPPAPVAGGSNTTASVCNVVAKACEQIGPDCGAAAAAPRRHLRQQEPSCLALADGMVKGPNGAPPEVAISRVTNRVVEPNAELVGSFCPKQKTNRAEKPPPGSEQSARFAYRPRCPPVAGEVDFPAPVSGFSSWYAPICCNCSFVRSSVKRLLSVLMSMSGTATYLPPTPRKEPTSTTTTSTEPFLLRTRSLTLPMLRFCESYTVLPIILLARTSSD